MQETLTDSTPEPGGRRVEGRPRVAMDPTSFKRSVLDHLLYTCGAELREAALQDFYQALAYTVRDRLIHRWLATQRVYEEKDVKIAYYLSSEFLTGRSLGLCLMNLGLFEAAEELAAERGLDLVQILDEEADPGLGNGGLGRLAACFMDSLATLELPAMGYGIRYDFGIFRQRIEGGAQVEMHDNWLQGGNPWELPRMRDALEVRLGGHTETRQDRDGRLQVDWVGARTILGVPYDSFIVGHKGNTVNTLRLWAARATRDFDLGVFNEGDYRRAVEEKIDSENISKVLYPNDQTDVGKALRLKQQYFFVACSIGDIVRRYKRRHRTFELFPKRVAIQLNDTHPSIAIAELMRILLDEEGLGWETAWEVTQATFAYTNHTLMPEALERWSVALLGQLLPRHLELIYEINKHFLRRVTTRWPGDGDRHSRMSIVEEGPTRHIRMAHLATVGSHSVNGVARLHTELIKSRLMPDFHELWPERFNNKTNGVSHRRFLLYANPLLVQLVSSRIGSEWVDRDLASLAKLREFAADRPFLQALAGVKRKNKRDLAVLVRRLTGVVLPPDGMYVTHVKRIHEYKRQLLSCLGAIAHYLQLKREPESDVVPRAYIFAGKAAPGYHMAKLHIQLINDVASVINGDPEVEGRLSVVFVPNYGVSLAQEIIPAADLSLQISTAGTEASGTGNMKLALNGALTLGTLDGANIEIRDAVGPENFFLFGLDAEQVERQRADGYEPEEHIARSPALAEALDLIESGFFSIGEPERFRPILDHLRGNDHYLVCADFDSYQAAEGEAATLYADEEAWSRRALLNIAGAGRFSADDTIRQYADEIWGLRSTPITVPVTHVDH